MQELLKAARKNKKLTQEKVAELTHTCPRTIWSTENEKNPDPFMIVRLSEIYNKPNLTQHYCKEICPIGREYSYEILDNVKTDITTIIAKLKQEMVEATDIIDDLLNASINDEFKTDIESFKEHLHELLDVDHNIEVLKVHLHDQLDIKEIIKEHNDKCIERNYTKKKNTPGKAH